MTKDQFIRLVKLRGRLNYLKRLKAAMENNPQKRKAIQPSKQDYMKAAGHILLEILEKSEKQNNSLEAGKKDNQPMTDRDPLKNHRQPTSQRYIGRVKTNQ